MTDLSHSNTELNRLTQVLRGGGGTLTGLIALLIVLYALFAVLMPDRFLGVGTVQSMMFQLPELGLLALAMVIPLISGGLNLAIIATTNQCALLMINVMAWMISADAGGGSIALGIVAALLAGFLLCLLIGLVTGWLVASLGVHPILVTLGTMSVIQGTSIYLTRGRTYSGVPESFQMIANTTVLGVPVSFVLFMLAALVISLILTRTAFGVAVHSVGSNIEATRYSGVDTKRTLIGIYTLSSLLCFFAACIMLARFNSASPSYAESYLLITILAAVLGGVDPFGGFGKVAGLVLALCVLQVISSGFNLLGLSQYLTLSIWGVTLIAVMALKTFWPVIRSRFQSRP